MIDGTTHTAPPTVRFDPPAPGQWELETGHHGLRPLSPFLRDTYQRAFEAGIVELMQRYGLPLVTVQAKFVHGCLYMRPLAVGEKPGSTPKAPPPPWLMKLDRPTAPRAAPTRQDRPAGVRRATLARRGRPVVRPRQVSAAGGEPRAAGGGARRARRCRARGTRHERAVALRTIGAQESGDARRRPGAHRRPAGALRAVGNRRQRGGRSAHRQLTGDGRDGRHARPGRQRDPAQRGAGGLARDGRRRTSTRPRRPSRRRRLARAAHVAHGHQRRRRPGHPGRGPRPATGGAARRHRGSRRRRTRRRSRSCPRPG